ncbi:hypothetical protein QF035_010902 [Streptomyces umbrinus]|uniref:Uncharacterized protein n=1 Tax=Streptomyces umbrinus TaxID=67370 RepID=A0ABU0TBY4_9ACTN|nr:hypothetical protein [Streptomyces umbrinus]MDQ1033320.1 hypothetical protein [Streptomyces umbrinus]
MPTSNGPSTPQELIVQEVLTCFATHARIRSARGGLLAASRVGPRDGERAFDDLQQAITQLRTLSRQQDTGRAT